MYSAVEIKNIHLITIYMYVYIVKIPPDWTSFFLAFVKINNSLNQGDDGDKEAVHLNNIYFL